MRTHPGATARRVAMLLFAPRNMQRRIQQARGASGGIGGGVGADDNGESAPRSVAKLVGSGMPLPNGRMERSGEADYSDGPSF